MQNYLLPDWFSNNIRNFLEIKAMLPKRSRVLEIGCFEGRSTSWILQHFLEADGTICCIDTFEGSPEHTGIQLAGLFERWQNNVKSVISEKQTCNVQVNKSYQGLANLIKDNESFDFIYVDGSHTAPDVLADACMSWDLLNPGGIILFDDYQWPAAGDENYPLLRETQKPKLAINVFAQVYNEKMSVVISNYQIAFRKF
jgi:predicted O-methyltransferase YrrM